MSRAAEIEAHPIVHGTRGHRHNTAPDVDLIRREWLACPNSRALSIACKCLDCRSDNVDAIRHCVDRHTCKLAALRPFQLCEPRGARHIDYREPSEEPRGLDPSDEVDD